MTITFQANGSTLSTRLDARVFTATDTLAYACVRFFDPTRPNERRAEEVVWRDGAFRYPYSLASTKVGNVYTVVRQGGWSKALELHVEELATPPPLPEGGQVLGAIYEVDFTALSSQSLPQGANTIDGLTWYAKCPSAGAFGSNIVTSLVHGQGLVFNQLNSFTGNHLYSGVVDWTYRHLFFPLAQLAGYNPLAPLLFRFHGTNGPAGSMGLVGGLCSSTNDDVNLAAADRQYDHLITGEGTSSSSTYIPGAKRGTGAPVDAFAGTGSPQLSYREAGVYRFLGRHEVSVWGPENSWSGSFVDVGSLVLPTLPAYPVLFGARPNIGIAFGVDGQTEVGPCTVTHMQVMQPRVSP